MNKYKRIKPVDYVDPNARCTHCSHEFYGEMKCYPYMPTVDVYCPKCKHGFGYEIPEKKNRKQDNNERGKKNKKDAFKRVAETDKKIFNEDDCCTQQRCSNT